LRLRRCIKKKRTVYWSQIVAGFLTIPVLGFMVLLGNSPVVSGRRNSGMENFWLGGAVTSMMIANLFFVWMQLSH